MNFVEIFEKTKYAFEHDEVYELLTGKKDYMYQAPRYPVSIPTCNEFIFRDGIYPYYRQLSPEERETMLAKFVSALRRMMREEAVWVWWALALLYGQKLSEAKYKNAPFFVADNLLKEIAPFLLANQEELKHTHDFEGAGLEDGLWKDVLRYNWLLSCRFGFVLLEV